MSLPGLSRADRLLLGIVLLTAVLLALFTFLLLPPEKTGGLLRQPSTFIDTGYGTKAAYLVLDRLGCPVTRLRRPLTAESLDGIGTLFILRPVVGLQDWEMEDLQAWVSEGHALVIVPERSSFELDDEDDHPSAVHDSKTKDSPRHRRAYFDDWFSLRSGVNDRKRETGESESTSPGSGTMLDAREPLCAGVNQLTTVSRLRFGKSPLHGPLADTAAETFWKDKLGGIGMRVQLGEGTIIALADANPFSNLGIGEADNGIFLANLAGQLSSAYPGKIAFDEFHLGFAERDLSPVAIAKLMLVGPWRWAVAQAILVGMIAVYAGAVRFGSPRDVTRRQRREHREFAEAAGRLLDEAGATFLTAQTLYRHYRERICRSLHLEADLDDARLAEAVRKRAGPEAAASLAQAQRAMSARVSRPTILTISQKLHHVAEAVEHGS
jgi:hypothetical protein